MDKPGSLRDLADRVVARAPDSAEPVLGGVVGTGFDISHAAIETLGLGVPLRETWKRAEPTYDAAWDASGPTRAAASQAWDAAAAAVRDSRS